MDKMAILEVGDGAFVIPLIRQVFRPYQTSPGWRVRFQWTDGTFEYIAAADREDAYGRWEQLLEAIEAKGREVAAALAALKLLTSTAHDFGPNQDAEAN